MGSSGRGQFSAIDFVVLGAILAGLFAVLPSVLVSQRSQARYNRCQDNLRRIGNALGVYHETHAQYPPATVQPDAQSLWTLKNGKDRMVVTHANWAVLLLPFMGEERLAVVFDPEKPISDSANREVRTAELPWMTCPEDTYHRRDNPYRCILDSGEEIHFARGNYGINGGTNSIASEPGTPNKPVLDGVTHRSEGRKKISWGNGIAGFNKSFSRKDMVNGLATTVAVDELRSGLADVDSRGSWALGQIGSSITFGHGIYGDGNGPNCRRMSADDIIGGVDLGKLLGWHEVTANRRMPCRFYAYGVRKATARSMHPGGVNVLMLDGSAHFVSDLVDLNVWHAIHSRKTPEKLLLDSLTVEADREALSAGNSAGLDVSYLKPLVASCAVASPREHPPTTFENSIGMRFVEIPSGEFIMGIPDVRFRVAYLEATPAHKVRITKPFALAVHAVTQEEYLQVMGENPSWHCATGGAKNQFREMDTSSFPVENVSWYDAVEFCQRLSALPTEKTIGRRYRLSTEAEWEYACRAGSTSQGSGRLAHSIGPVDRDDPNAFGVCGMFCSICEWCSDGYSRYYYARSPQDDPKGNASVYLRVARGSDWIFTKDVHCQLNAWAFPPSARSRFVGFRVVCETEQPKL